MKPQQALSTQAALLRGTFINNVAYIEKYMEYYIAHHFCVDEDRMQEMVEILLGDRLVSFESKRVVFENIMKTHFKVEHKANAKNFELLTSIQTERNKLAHLILNTGEKAIEDFNNDGTISFIKFKNSSKIYYYDKDYMEGIINDVDVVFNWMKSLTTFLNK